MAEQLQSNAIVPVEGEFVISVNDYDAAGKQTLLSAPMPNSISFGEWSVQQQVIMLKAGMWKQLSPREILWGLAYGHRLNADPMKGEIFPTGDGRWGTSNKFKIKQALATGKVIGIEVDMRDTKENISLPGCVQKTDLECTVTITVQGWAKPIIRKARLSRWFKAKNPNWVGNPEHMLELNTVAHACEYVAPGGTEQDEAPMSDLQTEASSVLGQAVGANARQSRP